MAQNITIWGASYSNVPAVTLPKTGGGTASFTDVSDTTAAASDVASGKYFYTSSGVKTEGTASGGGGSSMNVQYYIGSHSIQMNGYKATNLKITVAKSGTYKVSWTAWRGSSSGTMKTRLYIDSTAQTEQTTWTNTYGQHVEMTNVSLTAGQTITVYANSGNNSRYIGVSNLIIIQTS